MEILTPRNLIFTKLGNDVKVIAEHEIKEPFKNETPKLEQSVTNFYLKEINILKEELNKKEAPITELSAAIRNLTNNLKQQAMHSQSHTSDSDENHHIWTTRFAIIYK